MRIILTGGCTGGHIYPALAIGDKFREKDPNAEIIYLGHEWGLETSIVPKYGYELKIVDAMWFERSNIAKIFHTLRVNAKGKKQAYKIMREFKPDIVISTGSFVSVPVVGAAKKYGAKIYIHEQNAFPGMANKIYAGDAERVFLGFDSARDFFKRADNLVYSGNPVRRAFAESDRGAAREKLGIPADDFVILTFGGSLGAPTINRASIGLVEEYGDKEGVTILFGTGGEHYDAVMSELREKKLDELKNVKVTAYISDIVDALAAANIVIGRSGALSTAEISVSGRAAVFIPSPHVTGNHQYYNAKSYADRNAAFIVEEGENMTSELLATIQSLKNDPERLAEMERASKAMAHADAAEIIYEEIMRTYEG